MHAFTDPRETVAELEGQLRRIVQQMPAVLWSTDADLRLTSCAGGGMATLGLRPEEVVGTKLSESFRPADPDSPAIEAHRRSLLGASATYEQEWQGRTFEAQVEPLRDPAGAIVGTVAVALDISERKRVEAELEHAWQREREAAEHLRRLDEMKDLQLHAVSHDLRGSITGVIGSAALLERAGRELPPETRSELLRGIVESGRKLNRLVNAILDLDRLQRGILKPERESTDVAAVVRSVVSELELEDHLVEIAAEPVEASVDPVQVERIVENLVTNAAKHTPPGTPIWVRVEPAEGGVLLVVEDAGGGISEEMRAHVFEPFRRSGAAQGVGIGLHLVARFAELHGGWARISEREGGGSSFRVLLPPERADEPESGEAAVRRP